MPLPNLTIANFKSPRSLYFWALHQPMPSAVFFPNPAGGGLELRNTNPGGFASNVYGFTKYAQR